MKYQIAPFSPLPLRPRFHFLNPFLNSPSYLFPSLKLSVASLPLRILSPSLPSLASPSLRLPTIPLPTYHYLLCHLFFPFISLLFLPFPSLPTSPSSVPVIYSPFIFTFPSQPHSRASVFSRFTFPETRTSFFFLPFLALSLLVK